MAGEAQQQQEVPAVREGSRWRFGRPTGDEVAAWFRTSVPLDEGMKHEDFVSGVVLIPAAEKVKKQKPNRQGTEEVYELTHTPYVRIDTRVAYFHKLADALKLIVVIEAVQVPRVGEGAYKNDNMPDGFWWHIVVNGEGQHIRYLCCTQRVALYKPEHYFIDTDTPLARPVRAGVSTKQVLGGADINGLAKAETGAIGRALGVAGILVVGTGIATAEDMQDERDTPQALADAALPVDEPLESSEAVNERILALQEEMKSDAPEAWSEFSAWWTDRSQAEGWPRLNAAPIEVRRGMVTRMAEMLHTKRTREIKSPQPAAPSEPVAEPAAAAPQHESSSTMSPDGQ